MGLVGEIPSENGKLIALLTWELQANPGVRGTIPESFCNLGSAIDVLLLRGTSLTGSIPSCLGDLSLQYLALDSNMLGSTIPSELGNIEPLLLLWLDSNILEGTIPLEIANLDNIVTLYLNGNMLEGSIPSGLGSLMKLMELHLDNNMLTSTIPADLGKAASLRDLFVFDNDLSGDPLPVFNSMEELRFLMANNCEFEGEIDDEFLAGAKNISAVDLSHNRLTGSIPTNIFRKTDLQVLDLSSNGLSGGLPSKIPMDNDELTLFFLSLYNNSLSGTVPPSIKNLTELDHLDLSTNGFSGPMPEFLGGMTRLRL